MNINADQPNGSMRDKLLPFLALNKDYLMTEAKLPIVVTWTSDVPVYAVQASVMGIQDVLDASHERRDLIIVGPNSISKYEYPGADRIVKQALSKQREHPRGPYGEQLILDDLKPILHSQKWKALPHWDVMILNQDVTGRSDGKMINWAFGQTNFGHDKEWQIMSMQSVTRILNQEWDETMKALAIRLLLRHEGGHMFGLPKMHDLLSELPERESHLNESLGSHCTNLCTMRQCLSVSEMLELAKELEDTGAPDFCGECQSELNAANHQRKRLPADVLSLYDDLRIVK
jgi:predicted Zn-dependent protease